MYTPPQQYLFINRKLTNKDRIELNFKRLNQFYRSKSDSMSQVSRVRSTRRWSFQLTVIKHLIKCVNCIQKYLFCLSCIVLITKMQIAKIAFDKNEIVIFSLIFYFFETKCTCWYSNAAQSRNSEENFEIQNIDHFSIVYCIFYNVEYNNTQ